jgi:ketosteroid isomerase-like protein
VRYWLSLGNPPMSAVDANAALVRRYFGECVSAATGPHQSIAMALVDELLTADFVMLYNSQADDEANRGRERHKAFLIQHARSFPDDHWTIEALVAGQDLVACQWRFEANQPLPGGRIDVRAADFFKVRAGRLAELRRFLDFESFQKQIHSVTGG